MAIDKESPSVETSQERLLCDGEWGNAKWEMWTSKELPDSELCTAVACVAIYDLATDRVVLTRNHRGWEMLAGHKEIGETIEETLCREAFEEGGYIVTASNLFGHRKIIASERPAPGTREAQYPFPVSFMPYYYAFTAEPLHEPTGKEITERDIFTLEEIKAMVDNGEIDPVELQLIAHGLAQAHKEAL